MHILISGTLHKPAVTRTSANGNAYVTANIRTLQKNRDGETETLWVSVIAFRDEAREVLARLAAGDAVSVGGTCTLGIWEKDGEYHPSISVVADTVAVARPAQRAKSSGPNGGEYPESRTRASTGRGYDAPPAEPEFDDDIPF